MACVEDARLKSIYEAVGRSSAGKINCPVSLRAPSLAAFSLAVKSCLGTVWLVSPEWLPFVSLECLMLQARKAVHATFAAKERSR